MFIQVVKSYLISEFVLKFLSFSAIFKIGEQNLPLDCSVSVVFFNSIVANGVHGNIGVLFTSEREDFFLAKL